MSKLITTDNLAKLSAGLDARYKALINDSVSDMVSGSIDAAQTSILIEVKKQVDEVKEMLGGKSLVYLTQAEYDALPEAEKNDENIVYNITDSESADHEHENLEFLDKIMAINITIGNKTQVLDFNGNLNFSLEDIGVDNNHKHDEYYTEEEINNVVSSLEALISGKSDTGHNHDDKYYTESEMNEFLSNKASKDHSHDEFNTFATKGEMNSALEGKANKQHEHDEYATKLGLEEELEGVEESINSVSQSVTTLDTTLRGLINNKADSEHNHDNLYYTKSKVDENINEAITNQNNELTAEINRVESMLDGRSIVYITQAEYDTLSDAEKNDNTKTYFITDAEDNHNHDDLYYTEDEITQLLTGKSDLGHSHDDKYYTETEINTMLADKANKTHEHDDLATVDSLNNAVNTINAAISGKADKQHEHDEYVTKLALEEELNGVEESINSVSQSVTALDTTLRGEIGKKANSEHSHDDKYYTKSKVDENISEAVTNSSNELTAEINRIESMFDGKSIVYLTQAEYDALSEAEKNDDTKTYFITDAEDNHNHDDLYYTEDEINTLLAGKSDLGHNHDDKYYTETEINTLLADKANKTHEHSDLATVDSLNNAVNTINASISGKADKQHEHDEYVTKLGLEEDFEGIETSINSVGQSVTALETTLRGEIGKKADSGHNHNDLYLTKEEVSEDINEAVTNSSNVLSAEINRVESMLGGKSIIYITQAEYDALPESEKTNELKTYFVTDADDNHNHDDLYYTEDEVNQLLANKSDLGHNHNDKYYTETEINTMLADKANKTHEHSDLATVDSLNNAVNTINAAIAKKSDNTHNHDGDYYNKTEATTKFSDIEGDITSLGQEITALGTSISSAETRAKSYADQQITALVNSAPEAMNTLGELAKAISDHSTEYEAYIATVASNISTAKAEAIAEAGKKDTALHTTISAEIDGKIEDINEDINGKVTEISAALEYLDSAKANASDALAIFIQSALSQEGEYYDVHTLVKGEKLISPLVNTNTVLDDAGTTLTDHLSYFDNTIDSLLYSMGDSSKLLTDAKTDIVSCINELQTEINNLDKELDTKVEDINNTITTKEATLQAAIDGKAPNGHTHTNIVMNNCSNKDLNTIKTAGYYYGYTGMTNAPAQNISVMEVIVYSPDWIVQRFTVINVNGKTYERYYYNGSTWSEWKVCYDEKNKPTPEDIGASASGHIHDDRYFTETEANNAFAPKSHNHDDKYYTEDEIDTKVSNLESAINGKANSSHGTHVTWATTAPKANGTAAVGTVARVAREDHVHPLQESVSGNAGSANQVNNALKIQLNGGTTEGTNQFVFNGSAVKSVNITPSSIGASATGHNHNDSYYTKSQVDTAIAGVTVDSIQAAPKNHTHNQINSRGNVTAETANNRPAVGGLSMSQAYNNGYPTTYGNVMTMKGGGDGQLLIGWPGTNGAHAPAYIRSRRDTSDANWSEWAQIYTTANKPTVDDIGAAKPDNTIVSVSASNGVLTLTRDKRQKCTNLMDGTQIQFPSVSNTEFLEVHLYFKSESNLSILLPDNCKWRVDPNLDAGTSFELIVTWNSMEWLANLIVYS